MKIKYNKVSEVLILESYKETRYTFVFYGLACMMVTQEFKSGCEVIYGTGKMHITWLPRVPETEEELDLLLLYDGEPRDGCYGWRVDACNT